MTPPRAAQERAWPAFYRAFTAAKPLILASVLESTIHVDALPDALAALQASKLARLHKVREDQYAKRGPHNDDADIRQQITSFLDDYRSRRERHSPAWRKRQPSIGRGSYFKTSDPHEGDSLIVDPLSMTERGRIQRAFFRFEIFRKIFPARGTHSRIKPLFDERSQSDLFLPNFHPWEIEELICICQYLIRTIEHVFDEIEDDFVDTILKASASKPPRTGKTWKRTLSMSLDSSDKPSGRSGPSIDDRGLDPRQRLGEEGLLSIKEKELGYTDMGSLDWHCLNFFEDSGRRLDHKERIPTLIYRGLPFLKCYLGLDKSRRSSLTQSVHSPLFWPFLPDVLKARLDFPQDDSTTFASSDGGDTLQTSNLGWKWARKEGHDPNEYGAKADGLIRTWDYSSGMLDEPFPKQPLLSPGGRVRQSDRYKMPSAERRLAGVRVLHETLEDMSYKSWKFDDEYALVGDGLY
ncbi:MAG: hypothetical protein M4579_006161 [Chaenotheca gracillima]|nr:MAG: hypothetical protein M4579_006161 [Chaenotheca gracillima]